MAADERLHARTGERPVRQLGDDRATYEYGQSTGSSAYTFEMSPDDVPYQDDSLIPSRDRPQSGRPCCTLMERAWCPLGVLGASVRGPPRCGAFDDDLEVGRGWTIDPAGTDTAPASVRFGARQPGRRPRSYGAKRARARLRRGRSRLVTGAAAGSRRPNANDLDGRTTARSPAIDLPAAAGQRLTFALRLRPRLSFDHVGPLRGHHRACRTGRPSKSSESLGNGLDVDGAWRTASISMDRFAGSRIRIRFEAVDGGSNNLVEVEIDDVRITRPS